MTRPSVARPASSSHPRAGASLALGALSLVCFGAVTGIPAILMGRTALHGIEASGGAIGGRRTARAGWICGIVGTAVSMIGLLSAFVVFAVSAVGTA